MMALALASLRARALPVILVTVALTASLVLLLSIERIQKATENGFTQSISGVDLIIGPRSGGIELVLYTGFHLGRPTNNITMQTVEAVSKRSEIDWLVPIALGDSHRGHRVIATTADYFAHVRYAGDRSLAFSEGQPFASLNEVVLGARVAEKLGYTLGTELYLTHGSGQGLGKTHDDFAFVVTGILEPTGTPNDSAVFVGLDGYELIHLGWQSGSRVFSLDNLDLQQLPPDALTPKTVTAAYVGLKSKLGIFQLMRDLAAYPEEAISAVIPGVALAELWSIIGMIDRVFQFLSGMIIVIALIGLITMTLTGLDARTREMTILRAVGATPLHLASWVMLEAFAIGVLSSLSALGVLTAVTAMASEPLTEALGIVPEIAFLTSSEAITLGAIVLAGLLSSLWPAIMVYRRSLQQGLLD